MKHLAGFAVGAAVALVVLLLVDAVIRSWRRAGLAWRLWGPRCGAAGPDKLPDCGTCIGYRGHERADVEYADWHVDGTGFIWNATRWAWRGPVVDLAELYPDAIASHDDPLPHVGIFTEDES